MPTTPLSGESDFERLRRGDERAFVDLVGRHHDTMMRLARSFVPSHAVAEEVVQDTWLVVLRGVAAFEGRSSMKTWLYRILINRARSVRVREHRHRPVRNPERAPSRSDHHGQWAVPPEHWVEDLEDRLCAGELSESIWMALDKLPDLQRDVVTLRVLQGMTSTEVCDLLEITDCNQRVLFHRGRTRMRQALQTEFGKVW
jgi:RNA polymerase sigma-70 factor, ECF subfamily